MVSVWSTGLDPSFASRTWLEAGACSGPDTGCKDARVSSGISSRELDMAKSNGDGFSGELEAEASAAIVLSCGALTFRALRLGDSPG